MNNSCIAPLPVFFIPLLRLVLACCLITVTACSTTSQKPQWVDQPPQDYPAAQYLSAVGNAINRDSADSRARANLSKIFQVSIAESSSDFSQAIISSRAGKQLIDNQQRASRFVSSNARQLLEGSEIVEHWNAADGQIYSLAVLAKGPAAERFRKDIRDADRKTADLFRYAEHDAPNPVAALRALEEARSIQVKRDNDNRNLQLLGGKAITAKVSSADLDNSIRRGLASLQFAVDGREGNTKRELQAAAAGLGINLNSRSNYRLSIVLDTEPVEKKQGWYWLRGSLQLNLTHVTDTLAQQRWPVKVSATDPGMVEQRLKDAVNTQLGVYLYQLLTAPEQGQD